ncbi:mediator of RNA polymerase II transcription subunit 10 [Rhodotorula diobovata]|uniref:Mediator of RNA polymerase II transcription subunit 10 n=1 Tax=Rhodotorula diobovata TaxID=5288 RepID=A0A5C5FTY7_9BASI|nr:mediator of RNA polymerase II transcription subunit 10 [Rhodotorula diobovata]
MNGAPSPAPAPPPPPPPAATAAAAPPPPAQPAQPAQPVPPRVQVEQTLEHLLQTLLELGICASDVQETALESSPHGVASGVPGGLVGRKTQQTIEQLARLHAQKDLVADVNIPIEVINLVDQGKNPHLHTKNYIERLSGENMYTNGILSAVGGYRDLLRAQLGEAFPDLAEYVAATGAARPAAAAAAAAAAPAAANGTGGAGAGEGVNGGGEGDVKMEDVR